MPVRRSVSSAARCRSAICESERTANWGAVKESEFAFLMGGFLLEGPPNEFGVWYAETR